MKPYGALVLTLGLVATFTAAWGTKVTLQFAAPPSSPEVFPASYWFGLTVIWVFGLAAVVSGLGMWRQRSRASRFWEFFAWATVVIVIVWAVVETWRSGIGVSNLVEIVLLIALASSATLIRRRVYARVAT